MNQELCQTSIENLSEQLLQNWLKQQAKDYQLPYLLAHAEDGVIWGRFDTDSGSLITAREVFPECNFPELRLNTLQQCRIFGKAGEVLLWNSNGKWRSRLILETKASELITKKQIGVIPESQILWGTKGQENKEHSFTLLSDGSQGLKHAVPRTGINFDRNENEKQPKRPVKLEVHHYFCYDSDGVARIFISRLVSLK
ncbi:CRISPR-associated protein Csx19 [Planktothrix sp. FACHB-1365]|uniref:type III-D CRISPR-associated protein Csx19 n=1 Tax=Planktothrix sp. FACHB-1365 TaxID=2692855 RepID=UPI0016847DE1|nr:CRISPR-associated protein Csx19 [Planktothrix sp. FACHB-1365]MBD2483319.1 TIGR03984 family CRISPR-associated protein [Planktothrix sp. FACHB-1365]